MENDPPRPVPELAGELAELARHAPGRLAERLGGLALAEQATLALALEPRDRLELLLHSPQPMRLVRTLSDSELYLTVREIGPSDALPLLALASASQLAHLIDLESWRGDRFDGDRSGAWLALLVEAGEPTVRRFLRQADGELLALLFRSWLRVSTLDEEEQEREEDEHGFDSPDGLHRLSPTIPDHAQAAQRLVQLLFFDQPERYRQAVWDAERELPAELEEQCLRWRQSRLEEHGYPPWDESLLIYAPPARRPAEPPVPPPPIESGLAPSSGASLRLEAGAPLLRRGIETLALAQRERVLGELVALANRVLVADRADTGDPASHRGALERAAGSVVVALESRGAREAAAAADLLAQVPLLELFREGHARTLELQRRARALAGGGRAAALDWLDPPLAERIAGLLEPRPLYLDLAPREPRLRPFRSLGEVEETRGSVELVEILGRLFDGRLEGGARASTLLLTLLAWHAVRGELRAEPLPADVAASLLRRIGAAEDAAARALEDLLAALGREPGLPPRSLALLRGFGRASLQRLADECGGLDPDSPLDARFVTCLSLAGGKALD